MVWLSDVNSVDSRAIKRGSRAVFMLVILSAGDGRGDE